MAHGSARAERPRYDIADLVRADRAALEAEVRLFPEQRRVLSAIALCRTAALGGHLQACRSCDWNQPAYNSCRNRHCPKCQALDQERWIAARAERVLPTRHFHVVFTLPSELRPLVLFRPRALFNALMRAASETLLELGRSRLGAILGITMVLHTWTRELLFHPHAHAIVTAGGLALDHRRWNPSSNKYLFPVKVMGQLLRGKMLDALRKLHLERAFAAYDAFDDPEEFERLLGRLARHRWVVYAKRPFARPSHVLEYLGRYTHRVGISNSRLIRVTPTHVTFRTKHGNTATITRLEFLRRFVQHVLPKGFVKVRHSGLYAASRVDLHLETARALLSDGASRSQSPPTPWEALLLRLTGRDALSCPVCNGQVDRRPLPPPSRAPPTPLRVAA